MTVPKFYQRNIVEGKSFLIFSIVFAISIRVAYFLHEAGTIEHSDSDGYLWRLIITNVNLPIVLAVAALLMLVVCTFVVNYINTEHAFIRRRTLLPVAVFVLLLSCTPLLLLLSPSYFAVLAILLIINALFQGYSLNNKQGATYKSSFYLSLGSLFAPVLLLYFPILWICLVRMRSFNFKGFLASLFSIFIIYTPLISYCYITGNMDEFLLPFTSLASVDFASLPVLHYSWTEHIILGLAITLTLTVVIDNLINSYKDKIRIRAFVSVFSIISLFSILCTIFLNLDTHLTLAIALGVGALLIGHFFSLAEKKIITILFFFYLLIILLISILPLSGL